MNFLCNSKKYLIWTTLVFMLILLTSLNIYANEATNANSDMTIDQFNAYLDTQIPIMLKKAKVEGVAIAIVRDGQVVIADGYGFRDKKNKLPVKTDTVFQMASISKTFTAWGIMKLVSEGKIELDAPAENYLTRWTFPESKYDHSSVTIRRLLSHTAGISLSGYPGLNPKKPLPTLEASLLGKTGGVGKVYVKYEPGANFVYSGGGYTILQLIIEEVSGKPFPEYMAEEVLKPLGMINSTFNPAEVSQFQLAKGYDAWNHELPNYLFTAKAAAGLYSTVTDMAQWLIENLNTYEGNSATVLNSDTLKLMFKPVTDEYSLGYINENDLMIWHSGANAGWRSIYILLPNKRDGIVVLTNNDQGSEVMFGILNEWFAWENLTSRFNYAENFGMKLMYFYNILRNVVQ